MNELAPSTNGTAERSQTGQFAKGNSGGPGNPFAKQTAQLRSALLNAVTSEDVQAIAQQLVEKAKGGDLNAIKILFDRIFGKTTSATIEVQRPPSERHRALLEIIAKLTRAADEPLPALAGETMESRQAILAKRLEILKAQRDRNSIELSDDELEQIQGDAE